MFHRTLALAILIITALFLAQRGDSQETKAQLQTSSKSPTRPGTAESPVQPPALFTPSGYVLGPGDQIAIRAVNVEEISDKPIPIDSDGDVRIPVAGRIRAGGLTISELESEISNRLRRYVKSPDISVSIMDFRSQPVSVVGAVKNPGIYQVQNGKNLLDVLSLAGGLDPNAGSAIRIVRKVESGDLPVAGTTQEDTGRFRVAEIRTNELFESRDPKANIVMKPFDVVTVSKAEAVYVIGQVQKPGSILMNERVDVSVLQALSIAGGLDRIAKPQDAKILRRSGAGASRTEIPINVAKLLEGKAADVELMPEDILFIPSSVSKRAGVRALEAAVQTATGLAIWRIP